MNRRLRYAGLVVLVLVAMLTGMVGGVVLDRRVAQASTGLDTKLIDEAWNLINQHYVDRAAIKDPVLTYGAISGMVTALGDTGHTVFLSPEMVKQENNYTRGEFEGIGAQVEMRDGHVVIVAPMDNSPAQKAGLLPGDIILKVDGQDISGLSLDQVVTRILGAAGTQVTLTIADAQTQATRDVTLTRAHISVPSVSWRMLPDTKVAHLRIAAFSQKADEDAGNAIKEITAQGATGIILDLRNNPGGLLDGAVNVASLFLKDGLVLQEKDAQGNARQTAVKTNVPKTDLPMIVLVNAGTASASEIVAGALQDHQRATLLGEKTFGTGTVLNQFALSDGSALMLAVEEWLTPDGRTIWHQGITPDVVVTLASGQAPLTPEAEQGMTASQFQSSGDAQLTRALSLLGHPIYEVSGPYVKSF